jgi:hypothetical protein
MQTQTFRLAHDLYGHLTAPARAPDTTPAGASKLVFTASADAHLGNPVCLPADYLLCRPVARRTPESKTRSADADANADVEAEEVPPSADGLSYDVSLASAYELVHAPTGAVLVRMRAVWTVTVLRPIPALIPAAGRRRETRREGVAIARL